MTWMGTDGSFCFSRPRIRERFWWRLVAGSATGHISMWRGPGSILHSARAAGRGPGRGGRPCSAGRRVRWGRWQQRFGEGPGASYGPAARQDQKDRQKPRNARREPCSGCGADLRRAARRGVPLDRPHGRPR